MHHDHPELVRDQYWDEVFPQELPYTLASEPFREKHPLPSTANIAANEAELYVPSSLKIDDLQYDDLHSAINFTAKPGSLRRAGSSKVSLKRSGSSKVNMGNSVPDAMQRVNSVAGKLKRLFSKEDGQQSENKVDSRSPSIADLGQSTATLNPRTHTGSMRITDQVIEEVDEQLTITSQKSAHDTHPSVVGLFGPPPPSDPVPVPVAKSVPFSFPKTSPRDISQSAPAQTTTTPIDYIDNISIGSADVDDEGDEFTRLKNLREQERRSRVAQNLARSLSRGSDPTDTEMLLFERRPSSRITPRNSMQIDV